MSEQLVSNALVTQKKECPLCNSRYRSQLDLYLSELLHPNQGETVDQATGEIILSAPPNVSFTDIEKGLHALAQKLGDTSEFGLDDVIAHASQHTLVSHLSGLQIRSEGQYIFVGDQVFVRTDPKDALSIAIAYGLEQILAGNVKFTLNAWVGAQIALWRMQGNAGDDEFIKAMIDKKTKGSLDAQSPLGAQYQEHIQRQAQRKSKLEAEELALSQENDADTETGDTTELGDGDADSGD